MDEVTKIKELKKQAQGGNGYGRLAIVLLLAIIGAVTNPPLAIGVSIFIACLALMVSLLWFAFEGE